MPQATRAVSKAPKKGAKEGNSRHSSEEPSLMAVRLGIYDEILLTNSANVGNGDWHGVVGITRI